MDPIGKSHQYCFRIVLAKRAIILCASDAETMNQWIQALTSEHLKVMKIASVFDD